jgi:putative transposase
VTWYRWLNQYGSEKNAEASKRTKELVSDILNEVAKGKF